MKKYYNKDKVLLEKALKDVCKGINNLPEENIRCLNQNEKAAYEEENIINLVKLLS